MVILSDDNPVPQSQPTRDNIIRAMKWLVNDAQPHDSLFFHYSGHGGQSVDLHWDNVKGYDDTIYPVDFNRSGQINSDVRQQYSFLNIGNAFNYGKTIADWLSSNGSLRLLSFRICSRSPIRIRIRVIDVANFRELMDI